MPWQSRQGKLINLCYLTDTTLEDGPHADNTLVVFWSDHGFHLGEKEHWHKSTLWEESTRLPFIIAGPQIRGGSRCDRPASLTDLYPSLLDLCGLKPLSKLDGRSLKPLVDDPNRTWDYPAITEMKRGQTAIRSGRWRYIRYDNEADLPYRVDSSYSHFGNEELYDHGADPNEWENLAADPAYRDMKEELARWIPRDPAPEAPEENAYVFDGDAYIWKLKRDH